MKSLYHNPFKTLLVAIIALFAANVALAQSTIEGVIHDRNENPLVGATVSIKGTNTYSVANTEGQFKIQSQEKLPFCLVVRALGYTSQEVEVYELSDEALTISLHEDNMLNEVTI